MPARERSASPASEERNNKKQKVSAAGLAAGPAIHLPDPATLADDYKDNRPYRHLSVGGLFDDAVVSRAENSSGRAQHLQAKFI
jgi:hypothetical protein